MANFDHLQIVCNFVNSLNRDLTAKYCGHGSKSPFLHISHQNWPNFSDLNFVPSFNLIAKITTELQLKIQLVTYNGKLLPFTAEKFDLNNLNSVNSSPLIQSFLQGEISLCKGLLKSAKRSPEADFLRDFVSDRIVTRSRHCQYAIFKNQSQNCPACKSFNSQTISDSSEIEDLDDYNTEEFLDKNDIRVLSITNNLPEKLSKLSGITIHHQNQEIIQIPGNSGNIENAELMEPQVNLTVPDGKVLPFNDFRKDLNIESERQKIREPVLAKKRSKPVAEKAEKTKKNCPLCNKPFSDIGEFMKHLSTCDQDNNGCSDQEDNHDEDYKPVLRENGGKFAEFTPTLKRKKKPVNPSKSKKPAISVECTICMTTFKHDTNFPQHMKAHEDKVDINAPMPCPVCSVQLESRKLLNPHLKEHHPEKGGCCVECLEFMPMNLLKTHLSRKHHHAPEREGQLCPICGKKCYYTADLEIHIAVQHMGLALERPPKDEGEVMCHECGKVTIFFIVDRLRLHVFSL